MDERLRELERKAASGDLDVQKQLRALKSRISLLGSLENTTAALKEIKKTGRAIIIDAMQRIIDVYPIFGFSFSADYYEGQVSSHWLSAHFTEHLDAEWWHTSWYIGTENCDYEEDIEYLPEYAGVYGKSDDVIRTKLIEDFGGTGNRIWDTMLVLQNFRELFLEYPHDLMCDFMGADRWAVSSEGLFTDEEGIYAVRCHMTLEKYRLSLQKAEQRAQQQAKHEAALLDGVIKKFSAINLSPEEIRLIRTGINLSQNDAASFLDDENGE